MSCINHATSISIFIPLSNVIMSVQSIIAEHDPQVLFDAKLTPNEAAMAAQNLIQAAQYTNQEIRDAYVDEEVAYLKEIAIS